MNYIYNLRYYTVSLLHSVAYQHQILKMSSSAEIIACLPLLVNLFSKILAKIKPLGVLYSLMNKKMTKSFNFLPASGPFSIFRH